MDTKDMNDKSKERSSEKTNEPVVISDKTMGLTPEDMDAVLRHLTRSTYEELANACGNVIPEREQFDAILLEHGWTYEEAIKEIHSRSKQLWGEDEEECFLPLVRSNGKLHESFPVKD